MTDVQPLRAFHYNLAKTGGLQDVISPPYDVIDEQQRAALAARSPYNVVAIDLPQGDDPYQHAAGLLATWRAERVIVQDDTPALWALTQDYTGPDGRRRTRTGILARVRIEDYGPGRIRPHERTHPGPKEDRLRLTRATKANLSPIFSLFSDPDQRIRAVLAAQLTAKEAWASATDKDGTEIRLWRSEDEATTATVHAALTQTELLIADGHHRYETARTYAREIGGDGPHNYVLMCLVALEDPGLTVFPTHRLVRGLTQTQQADLAATLRDDFDCTQLADRDQLVPEPGDGIRFGYIDAHSRRPFMLTLKSQQIADAALPGHAEPYRRLDAAVLEALILKDTLHLSDEDIDHLNGLGYARDLPDTIALIDDHEYDAAFVLAPTPMARIQRAAASGETMPPKSTFFYPKVPTGLVFNPLV